MSRFLVDENLSPDIARHLRGSNHDAVHVNEVGLRSASDDVIWAWATRKGRTVITRDQGFERMQRAGGARGPSVIRVAQRGDDALAGIRALTMQLRTVLPEVEPRLAPGVSVTLDARGPHVQEPIPGRVAARAPAGASGRMPPTGVGAGVADGFPGGRAADRATPRAGRPPRGRPSETGLHRSSPSRPLPAPGRARERSRDRGAPSPDRGR